MQLVVITKPRGCCPIGDYIVVLYFSIDYANLYCTE